MKGHNKGIFRLLKIFLLSLLSLPKEATVIATEKVTALDNVGEEMDENIALSLFSNGTVVIDGNHGFTRSSLLAEHKESIKRLVIGEGLFHIPEFTDFRIIKQIEMPSTLRILGENAFRNCTALKAADLEYVYRIGDAAFKNCSLLERIHFPKTELVIGYEAFANCACLKQVRIPCVNEIFYDAFKACACLSSLEICGNKDVYCPSIYGGAFSECRSLRKVKLRHIGSIDCDTFRNCTKLRKIEFDHMCPVIYQNAFKGCESLKEVRFPEDFTYISGTDIGLGVNRNGRRIPGFTIRGRYKSNAYAYASEKHIRFKTLDEESR